MEQKDRVAKANELMLQIEADNLKSLDKIFFEREKYFASFDLDCSDIIKSKVVNTPVTEQNKSLHSSLNKMETALGKAREFFGAQRWREFEEWLGVQK